MKDLLDAIYTKYNIDDSTGTGVFVALRAANTGGLYLVRPKEQNSYPYMSLVHAGNSIEYTMSNTIKDAVVQFSIFSDTFSEIMTVYAALFAAFDDTVLSYDNDKALVMQRVSETGPILFEDVWQVTIDYQVMRQT
jgi:hypothetical protein